MKEILAAYGFKESDCEIRKFGTGLINFTYLIHYKPDTKYYILQEINTNVFKKPEIISNNIDKASKFLSKNHPEYVFAKAIDTIKGENLFFHQYKHWRLSKFVENAISFDKLNNPALAYEAAKAFGIFTKNLEGIDKNGLEESIPNFHNLSFRYLQFQEAINTAIPERLNQAQELVNYFQENNHYVSTYESIVRDEDYPKRMIHHDTKISNVLFDKNTEKSIAVCDLDTMAPGRIISDLGDMVRTYTSQENEESTDYKNVTVRKSFFEALAKGYISEIKNLLTGSEIKYLNYAGPFMIYMQGLRFITDFLTGDKYYATQYEMQNLNRATNQQYLLNSYKNQEAEFQVYLDSIL